MTLVFSDIVQFRSFWGENAFVVRNCILFWSSLKNAARGIYRRFYSDFTIIAQYKAEIRDIENDA